MSLIGLLILFECFEMNFNNYYKKSEKVLNTSDFFCIFAL